MRSMRRTAKAKPASRTKKPKPYRVPGATYFPQVEGKVLQDVSVETRSDYSYIELRFDDRTNLVFDIVPGFTLQADYSDWKTGNQRIIKRWPRMRREGSD